MSDVRMPYISNPQTPPPHITSMGHIGHLGPRFILLLDNVYPHFVHNNCQTVFIRRSHYSSPSASSDDSTLSPSFLIVHPRRNHLAPLKFALQILHLAWRASDYFHSVIHYTTQRWMRIPWYTNQPWAHLHVTFNAHSRYSVSSGSDFDSLKVDSWEIRKSMSSLRQIPTLFASTCIRRSTSQCSSSSISSWQQRDTVHSNQICGLQTNGKRSWAICQQELVFLHFTK